MEELKQKPKEHNVDAPGEPISEKKRKKRNKNLIFYPLGTVGRDMMYFLFNNCILTYIMLTKQLTSKQLLAISGIMIAARIFDALNDPIMGNITDRTVSKFGAKRFYILIGAFASAVTFIMMWLPLHSENTMTLYFFYLLMYCLFYCFIRTNMYLLVIHGFLDNKRILSRFLINIFGKIVFSWTSFPIL